MRAPRFGCCRAGRHIRAAQGRGIVNARILAAPTKTQGQLIPAVLACEEVRLLDSWPQAGGVSIESALARRINEAITVLLLVGIEPDQITIDIDRRAVIIRAQEQIHLRAL